MQILLRCIGFVRIWNCRVDFEIICCSISLLTFLLMLLFPFWYDTLYVVWSLIVFESVNVTGDELISPCMCKGTQQFVHRSCLDHWRSVKVRIFDIWNFYTSTVPAWLNIGGLLRIFENFEFVLLSTVSALIEYWRAVKDIWKFEYVRLLTIHPLTVGNLLWQGYLKFKILNLRTFRPFMPWALVTSYLLIKFEILDLRAKVKRSDDCRFVLFLRSGRVCFLSLHYVQSAVSSKSCIAWGQLVAQNQVQTVCCQRCLPCVPCCSNRKLLSPERYSYGHKPILVLRLLACNL